jgi:16S rRNA processing protein RimM
MNKIKIGQVVNVVGLKGELKIYPYSESKERFESLKSIYFEDRLYMIEKVRYKDNLVILKVEGVDDRNRGEACKGKDVYMPEADLETLPTGTYYVKDILGFPVEDAVRGMVGILVDVKTNGPQDLFVIKKESGDEFFVPAVEEFFVGVDLERKVVLVELIEGMYEN